MTIGRCPRRFSIAAAPSPAAPAPTTTTSASASVGGMVGAEDEQESGQDTVEDDRDRPAEPALAGPPPHSHDVADEHRRRIQGAEADHEPAECRLRLDRRARLGEEARDEPTQDGEEDEPD